MLSSQAAITEVSRNLSLITLVPPINGFEDFIGVWLYRGSTVFVVDVGPASTAEALLEILDRHQVTNLDYIFLTHIHLDHAGGVGAVAERFPRTPIVCHETAIPHLVNPNRLGEGTVKTLGSIGEAYGPIQPVSRVRLTDAAMLKAPEFESIDTPGHAPHHVSYRFRDILFAGEAGGIVFQFENGPPYQRPSTPPKLRLKVFLASLDRLISRDVSKFCPGHHGFFRNSSGLLKKHRNQLKLWEKVIKETIRQESGDDLADICLSRLLSQDPLMMSLHAAPATIQDRERFFLANSVRGFIEDLQQGSRGDEENR